MLDHTLMGEANIMVEIELDKPFPRGWNVTTLNNALETLMEAKDKMNEVLETLEIKDKPMKVELMKWLRKVEEIAMRA